jgi:hypothetical protein
MTTAPYARMYRTESNDFQSGFGGTEVMIATRVALKATLRAVSAVALTAVALFTSGCSVFSTPIGSDTIPMAGAAIHGMVHGGRQPISGASIGLYAAGSGGYGSSSGVTNLLVTPVSTAGDGTFTITGDYGGYTCTAGSLLYITASGGDAGSGSNSAIMLVAPLGPCGGVSGSTYVVINEVTTAATAIALGQFIAPAADSIAASSTNSVGLTNAFATVNNLVNTATGVAVTSTTSGSVTATPEYNKLNGIADILAACVNTSGPSSTPCTTLFGDVTSGTAPTDTLQAAVYMSQNPTSNSTAHLTALWNLATATPPFSYGSQAQPTDWTVGILYTSSGSTSPVYDPQNIAIDAGGNVWIINANGKTDNLAELGPTGTPLITPTVLSTSAQQFRNLAIDTNGNAWFGTSSATPYTYEYKTNGTLVNDANFSGAYAVAINGSNDVFFGRNSSSACGTKAIGEFTADTLVPTTNLVMYGCQATAVSNTYAYMAIDASNNLWITNTTATGYITQVSSVPNDATVNSTCTTFPCTTATTPAAPTLTYTTINSGSSGVPTFATPYGIAVGLGGANVWFANNTGPSLTEMTSVSAGSNIGDATSLTKPTFLAVDGAGNLWVSDNIGSSPAAVSEFSSVGAILSPANGVNGSTTVGFSHAGLFNSQGIGIDPSGNVWVADQVAAAGAGSGVFEIVGAAVPTVTPIASALSGTVNATGHGIGQKP